MSQRCHLTYTTGDFAIEYAREKRKLNLIKTEEKKDLERLYVSVAKMIFKEISLKMIHEGLVFKIPEKMGHVVIVKEKVKIDSMPVDKQNSKIYKKLIVHHNLHSNGYVYSYYWKKGTVYTRFANQSYYKFTILGDKTKKVLGSHGLGQKIKQVTKEGKDYYAPDKSMMMGN